MFQCQVVFRMVNLYCQLVWVLKHDGNIAAIHDGMSKKLSLESEDPPYICPKEAFMDFFQRLSSIYILHYSMESGSTPNKKETVS